MCRDRSKIAEKRSATFVDSKMGYYVLTSQQKYKKKLN